MFVWYFFGMFVWGIQEFKGIQDTVTVGNSGIVIKPIGRWIAIQHVVCGFNFIIRGGSLGKDSLAFRGGTRQPPYLHTLIWN